MGSFFDSGPLPNWKDIQQWLGKEMPWKLAEKWDNVQDSSWLDRYVDDLLRKKKSERPDPLRTQIAKDAKTVTVTMALPSEADPDGLRLFAAPDRLRIAGLPDGRRRIVRFPCLVYARSGQVSVKDGRLVARFRRRPSGKDEIELFLYP